MWREGGGRREEGGRNKENDRRRGPNDEEGIRGHNERLRERRRQIKPTG